MPTKDAVAGKRDFSRTTKPTGNRAPRAVGEPTFGSQAWILNLLGSSVSVVDTATNTVT
ncbi:MULTISPECIES: hypothetical protein [unclassified Kitasatospora]|uniref:hypothetical protein n=1 Tax=unclassified Kitasatospora TaxID=2633591 RepID=UPI0033CA7EE5